RSPAGGRRSDAGVSRTRRGRAALAVWTACAVALVLAAGCAARRTPPPAPPFEFMRDTFSFPNETVWVYNIDAAPRQPRWPGRGRDAAPPLAPRGGKWGRAARQFRLNARFAPERPPPDDGALAGLVAGVFARDARDTSVSREPIVIPGYADLRGLSAAHEALM